MMYTDLPMWLAFKLMFLGVPLTLTLTIPAGLLAAVMIVFGRMSSDRELLALKASRHRPRAHRRPGHHHGHGF